MNNMTQEVQRETYNSYAMALSKYATFRTEVEADPHMDALLDAIANVEGIVPLFHCSGHGKGRITIMLAVKNEKAIRTIFSDLINKPNLKGVNLISTELSNVVKLRRNHRTKSAYLSWSLRVTVKRNHEIDMAQTIIAIGELVDLFRRYRPYVVTGSVTNPLIHDREQWTVNYIIPKEALFAWEQLSIDGRHSINHALLSPRIKVRENAIEFLNNFGKVTYTANPVQLDESNINYLTELNSLSHLLG